MIDLLPQHRQTADEQYWYESFKLFDIEKKIAELRGLRIWRLMRRHLVRGQKILEGGAGIGKYTIAFQREGLEATGIDYSKALLAKIRKEAKPEDAARFRYGDVRKLPFKAGTFDAYFSPGVIEHFPQQEQDVILGEAHRVLKAEGTLLITVPYINWLSQLRARSILKKENRLKSGGVPFYQYRYSVLAIHRLLARNGFKPGATYIVGLHDTRIRGIRIIPKSLQNNPLLLRLLGTTLLLIAKREPDAAKTTP